MYLQKKLYKRNEEKITKNNSKLIEHWKENKKIVFKTNKEGKMYINGQESLQNSDEKKKVVLVFNFNFQICFFFQHPSEDG